MNEHDDKLLPEDIQRIRLKLGLTQEQAGERIGGGRRAFSKYESGIIRPSAAVANLLTILDRHPDLITQDNSHVRRQLPAMGQSPFEITANDLKLLTSRQFIDLIQRLLTAEALANDLPEYGIHVASNINAPDGGEDARIFWVGGVKQTSFLPSRQCQFQMKTGAISPEQARQEIMRRGSLKPMVLKAIEEGFNYIMLSTQPYVMKLIEARKQKIRSAIQDSGIPIHDAKVEFRGGDQIAAWVNSHPSVALWLAECVRPASVGPFTTYDGWGRRSEFHAVSFVGDSRFPEIRERIRACVTVPGNALRVVGLSGIGKSRLIFEALEREAGKALVMYTVESENPIGTVQSTVRRLADSQRRAVVVIDECDPNTHRQLVGMVSWAGSKISLVTIEDEFQRNSSGNTTHVVSEAPTEVVEAIVEEKLPDIPNEDKRRLTQFAKGFPAVAVRITGIWEFGVPIAYSTENDLVDKFVTGRSLLNPDHLLKSAQLVSVFGLLGWEHLVGNQASQVAEFDRVLTLAEFRRGIHDLVRRGVVQQRGRYVKLQPIPISMNLAARQWEEWGSEQWDTVLTGSIESGLKITAARQLALINTTDIAKKVAKHVCRLDGPLSTYDRLSIDGHAEVLSSLAEIDKDAVATLVDNIVSGFNDLRLIDGDTRRNLVVAVEKIAFHPDTFDLGADLLLDFAIHENEHWGNNATETFKGLFQLYLGGTAADAQARLQYIDHAIKKAADVHSRLAILVEALGVGIRLGHFTRTSGAESHGALEALTSWQPRTNRDIHEYTSGFVTRLAKLGVRDDEIGELARKELGAHVQSLVNGGFIDLVESSSQRIIDDVGYWPDGLRSAVATLRYGETLPNEIQERVNNIVRSLRSTDLQSRVDSLVTKGVPLENDEIARNDIMAQYHDQVDAVSELAKELNANVDVMSPCLRSLVRGNQHMAYEFGEALGDLSDDSYCWLRPIIDSMKETEVHDVNDDLLVGYLKGLHAEHPSKVAMVKETLATLEFFAPGFVKLCSRLGEISRSDLILALNSLRQGHLKPHHLRLWSYGGILAKTPHDDVAPFFDALISHSPQGVMECAELMGMYMWSAKGKMPALSSQIIRLAAKSDEWGTAPGQKIGEYHFQQLMVGALNRGRNDSLAKSVALQLSKGFVEINGYRPHKLFKPILPCLLSGFPEIAWPIIGQAIVNDERKAALLMFELGGGVSFSEVPDSAILNLPEDVLFAWCYANPEKAPAFTAKNLPFLTTLDRNVSERNIHPRMLRLIDEFGQREDVREEISANIFTFGWGGSTTEYYQMFYEPLALLAKHQNRDVSRWARQVSSQLKTYSELAENEDDEWEARGELY